MTETLLPLHRRISGRLVAATHNKGKLAELRDLLQRYGLDVVGAGDLGLPEPEETGDTFTANALLKARAGAAGAGLPALADDSGLCVAGLDDAPGIYSARWAEGDFSAAMARIERELLARAAPAPWRAHFISVLAIAWPDGHVETFEGRVDGELTFPPRGSRGFGYDPIFIPDGHKLSFGEMTADQKHGLPSDGSLALSHRVRAFQKLARACLA
jgi:XTP/dITP diphosphohydrolase